MWKGKQHHVLETKLEVDGKLYTIQCIDTDYFNVLSLENLYPETTYNYKKYRKVSRFCNQSTIKKINALYPKNYSCSRLIQRITMKVVLFFIAYVLKHMEDHNIGYLKIEQVEFHRKKEAQFLIQSGKYFAKLVLYIEKGEWEKPKIEKSKIDQYVRLLQSSDQRTG